MADERDIAEVLLKSGAVTLSPHEPYTFASGIRSPIYCDNRLLISYPAQRKQICLALARQCMELHDDFDVLAGTASAGIPWASWLAEKFEKPMVYVRSASKGHGKSKQIEGELDDSSRVLVIEDLISTGSSVLNACEALREFNAEVVGVQAIFSYNMSKANDQFSDAALTVQSLSGLSVLLEVAQDIGLIDADENAMIKSWQKDPENWMQDA